MLKLRIFIWRYRVLRNQNLSIFDSAIIAKEESKKLESHFLQLKSQPQNVNQKSFWQSIEIRKEASQQIETLSNYLQNIKPPKFEKQQILEVLKLYNQSIQALLEGKREVIQNDNFVFKDGQSLQQKVDNIKNILQRITNQ